MFILCGMRSSTCVKQNLWQLKRQICSSSYDVLLFIKCEHIYFKNLLNRSNPVLGSALNRPKSDVHWVNKLTSNLRLDRLTLLSYLLSSHTVCGAAAWGSCHTAASGSSYSAARQPLRTPASKSAWSHPPTGAKRSSLGLDLHLRICVTVSHNGEQLF